MALIEKEIRIHRPQVIVGSSCGGFYARMFVSAHRKVILKNPHFAMTEFLQTRIGTHQYKSPRADHRQEFKVTQRLMEHFRSMEAVQFADYTPRHKRYVYGLFGTRDTLAHFRPVYDRFYVHAGEFDGGHTMTAENVKEVLAPLVRKVLRLPKENAKGTKGAADKDISALKPTEESAGV